LVKSKKDVKKRVEKALEQMREYIESHGGGFEVTAVSRDKIKIKIKGACLGCPMAQATFGAGMEEVIKKAVPEIKDVEFTD
jgi:Fe-S cluster biogenesis protein NfuA